MTNTNDQRILDLKKQIEVKKEKLGKSLRFTPLTNCSIEFEDNNYNIHASSKRHLIELLIKLNIFNNSAKELGYDEYEINGYKIEDWMTDVKSKLEILSRKDEEKKLKVMEDKLVQLLSDGKKVELEIDEIESILKN